MSVVLMKSRYGNVENVKHYGRIINSGHSASFFIAKIPSDNKSILSITALMMHRIEKKIYYRFTFYTCYMTRIEKYFWDISAKFWHWHIMIALEKENTE